MKFSKYHGCKNDFIVVSDVPMSTEYARLLCDRNAGIGADGVALVKLDPPTMKIFNADGSVPEMCGNAFRCVVKYLVDNGHVADEGFADVITDSGTLRAVYTKDKNDDIADVTVDMGPPRTPVEERVVAAPRRLTGYTVSMGNPHFVTFSERPMHDAREMGLAVSTHRDFPEGVNASFARILDRRRIEAVVYERGAGLTQACGTGACAIVAVARDKGLVDEGLVDVQLPGGTLTIGLSEAGHLLMRGPATWVFDGEL